MSRPRILPMSPEDEEFWRLRSQLAPAETEQLHTRTLADAQAQQMSDDWWVDALARAGALALVAGIAWAAWSWWS